MEDNTKLILYLAVWMIAAGLVFFRQLRKGSIGAGLSLAYLINLWILHWVASTLYLLPGYSYYDPADVIAGLEQSAYAVVAFCASYMIFGRTLAQTPKKHDSSAISGVTGATKAPVESAPVGALRVIPVQQFAGNQPHRAGETSKALRASISDGRLTNMYIGIGLTCYVL